jgi:hypothetical protein
MDTFGGTGKNTKLSHIMQNLYKFVTRPILEAQSNFGAHIQKSDGFFVPIMRVSGAV